MTPTQRLDAIIDLLSERVDENTVPLGDPRNTARCVEWLKEVKEDVERLTENGQRLDWLEMQYVTVRIPLVYGSRECFTAMPDDSVEGEEYPSDLRAKTDALARTQP